MSKKKVLILFTSSELGGAEKSLTRLALNLQDKINVQLATMDGKGPWIDYCKKKFINPISLGNRKNKNSSHGNLNFINQLKLFSLLYKGKFDIVYAVGIRLSLLIRFIIFFLRNTKYVNAIRWNPASSKPSDIVFRFLEKYFSIFVDLYICNSQASKTTLIQKCKIKSNKIKVIYNGIGSHNIKTIEHYEQVLLITANNSPRKGIIEFILNVVKPVFDKGKKFHLFIAGRDEMNGKIKEVIQENNLDKVVTYLGFIKDIDKYFQRSDIFILPSIEREGCPTSILEAMSYAKPTIAFNIDGIPELIKNGEQGFLIDAYNYKDFQKALLSLLENKPLREQMGKSALSRQKKIFNIDQFTSKHIQCFESLVSNNNN